MAETRHANRTARPQERVFFDALLRPNASLSRTGFRLFMGAFAAIALGLGGLFYSIGAWPIFGFLGLDVLLIYWLFGANYRAARRYEQLRLTDSGLTVRRVNPWGKPWETRFEPAWLRVQMDDPPEHESRLTLSSHGRSVHVGGFLTPEERLEVAQALQKALAEWRAPPPLRGTAD